MSADTLYSYTINGLPFDDAIDGVLDSAVTLERVTNNGDVDSNIRVLNDSELSFSGGAYDYICSKLPNLCFAFVVEITGVEGMVMIGTFYSYMVKMDIKKKIASTQIKDTSWSSILRNRTNRGVYLGSYSTVGCQSIDRLYPERVIMFNRFGQYINEVWNWWGFDALKTLQWLTKVLTDYNMTFFSEFLTSNPVALMSEKALKNANLWGTDYNVEEVYLITSFDRIVEFLSKVYNMQMNIVGNNIYFEPSSEMIKDEWMYEIDEMSFDATMVMRDNIFYDNVKVGSTGESVDLDSEDEQNKDYNTFIPVMFNTFTEQDFQSCSCDVDKDNVLDLTFDMTTDSNYILKNMNVNVIYSDEPKDLMIAISCYRDSGLLKAKGTDRGDGQFYYNKDFLVQDVIDRWTGEIGNCITSTELSKLFFQALCSTVYQGSDTPEFKECTNSVGETEGVLNGDYNGYMWYIDPLGVNTYETGVDTFNGWNDYNILPNDFYHYDPNIDAGNKKYSGYKMPFSGWVAFTANMGFSFTPDIIREVLNISIAIVVFDSDNFLNEIYRKTSTFNYENVDGSTFEEAIGISSDGLFLNAGNVVVVAIDVYIESEDKVLDSPDIFNVIGLEFRNDSLPLGCTDIRREVSSLPYLYEFDVDMCLEDFLTILEKRTGYIKVEGKKMWVEKISRTMIGATSVRLITDKIICKC